MLKPQQFVRSRMAVVKVQPLVSNRVAKVCGVAGTLLDPQSLHIHKQRCSSYHQYVASCETRYKHDEHNYINCQFPNWFVSMLYLHLVVFWIKFDLIFRWQFVEAQFEGQHDPGWACTRIQVDFISLLCHLVLFLPSSSVLGLLDSSLDF